MTVAAPYVDDYEPFRLSMLIRDKRYRAYTIQVFTMIAVMLVVAWLVNNVIQNFEALGKTFSFSFLWQPASYDINQRLIEYTSRSPHWVAAIVGILNTLVIAVLGCILATVLGVAIGVARLSKNWLLARMMTVYIEGFRNVPVLLWILLVSTVLSTALASPRQAPVLLGGNLVPTNRGTYIASPVFEAGSGILFGIFVLSLLAIWAFRRWAAARQQATGEILPVFRVSLALFFIPTLVAFFALGQPVSL
ncbi:MAG: ABC transporter permease subunit, partial [Pseudomonadota bacterium]